MIDFAREEEGSKDRKFKRCLSLLLLQEQLPQQAFVESMRGHRFVARGVFTDLHFGEESVPSPFLFFCRESLKRVGRCRSANLFLRKASKCSCCKVSGTRARNATKEAAEGVNGNQTRLLDHWDSLLSNKQFF